MGSRRVLPLAALLPALLLSTGGEPGGAEADGAASAKAAPTPADGRPGDAFDPATVALPGSAPERAVLAALSRDDPAQALSLAQAALVEADPASRGRLLWLAARASEGEAVEPLYRALGDSGHPLARWAKLRRAEALQAIDPTGAADLAQSLDQGWAGAGRARVIEALGRYAAQDYARAEPLLRALWEAEPQNSGAATAGMPLAEILTQRGDPASLEEAIELYRRVASRAPLSDLGRESELRIQTLLARLPPRLRKKHALPSIEDEFQRGTALLWGRQNEDAHAAFTALAARITDDPELRCRAELEAGRGLERQRSKRQETADYMKALAARCSSSEIKAWARFYAGRAYLRLGMPAEAIDQFAALRREAPDHSLCDDALQLEAAAHTDAGAPDAAEAALTALVEGYPDGDMRADARFTRALDARARGDHAAALAELEALLREGPGEDEEGEHGRAAYFRARTLVALGRKDDAVAAYVGVWREHPLSYYAQQALARLRELDAASARRLIGELGGKGSDRWWFYHRPEMDQPEFASAIELLRVGEVDLALRELRQLGALGEGADPAMLWLSATLLHYGGAYPESSGMTRRRLASFRATLPRGKGRRFWRVAYPHAFSPLIEQAAQEAGVPPAFVRAVAREESSFDPEAVSSANAYGLIQLIVPTARAHARNLGLPSDPGSLRRPEINLRIGADFMRELWQRYANNPTIVPAAYNAGHGSANRWLKERPNLDVDEWIERIPYKETRRYTRRVLQSYGIYTFLDTGKLPTNLNNRKLP